MGTPMAVQRDGGCLCGQVRYIVTGAPLRVGLCHCTDCRKTSGSTFTAFAIWPRHAFKLTGHLATYDGRSFCANCGARLCSLTPDEAEIMVGSLDAAPTDLAPEYELWIGRREDWLLALPWATQFEHDREPAANSIEEQTIREPADQHDTEQPEPLK